MKVRFMKKNTTIKDVARYAQVSIATVSNVLNNVDKASEETKRKVMEAVHTLEYHPNVNAQSLVRQKSNLIGLIFPLSKHLPVYKTFMGDNPFYTEYICGVECSARSRGYDVLITGAGDERQCKEWISKRKIDGAIIMGKYPDSIVKELEELQIPFVMTDAHGMYSERQGSVGINDELGGYIATKHLTDLGHKMIAFAAGDLDYIGGVNHQRYQGYQRALEEVGINSHNGLVFIGTVSFDGGYEIGFKIMERLEPITAVVTVADIMAFGILKSFTVAGRRVPEDYSVVGFDDLKECAYVTPGLTTIRQDIFQKGAITAETLINGIEYEKSINSHVELPLTLIIRNSTGRPSD